MKYKLIPIIKSPKFVSKKIHYNNSNQNIKKNQKIKLPLTQTSHSKYLSSSNITNPSNRQNLSTNYSIANTLNNITATKNQLSKTKTLRRPLYHSPKNIFNPQKIDNNIINTASNILKQRNNERIFMFSLQRNSKKEIINSIKEISLKNYHIDLLRKKRIDIDAKENFINQSLMQSSHKLEKDYEYFLNIIDRLKTEQKKDEEKLGEISNIYENTLNELTKETNINKKLNSNIIKEIKLISNYKRYGSFLYKIFGMTYPYEEIDELDNILKISEDIREKVIRVYQKVDKVDIEIFGNVETLMKRFEKYEEILIKHLSNKEKVIKDYKNMLFDNINEIFVLKQKRKMFKEDLNEAISKKKKLMELMSNIFNLNTNEEQDINNINNMQYVDENLETCVSCIKDIGNCLEIERIKGNDIDIINSKTKTNTNDLKDYIDYAKDIIKCLKEKEEKVNEYTTIINDIINCGSHKDKQIILNLLGKMKRDNKFKKIINIRNKREELSNEKRLNEYKRSQKNVIYQKRVFIDVPIKVKHNKTQKVNLKEKNDYEFLYYSSEESEENDNKMDKNRKIKLKFIRKKSQIFNK